MWMIPGLLQSRQSNKPQDALDIHHPEWKELKHALLARQNCSKILKIYYSQVAHFIWGKGV